ncbi:MAG: carbohydrate kinase family protein [Pyrinomonadaceae bacterium]
MPTNFPFSLLADADFDVIGFGTNAVDHLIRVPEYPVFNSKVELTDHVVLPGGEIASTMYGLQKLGVRTAYVGRFGNDAAGELGYESLASSAVDMSYCEKVDGAATQVAFIIVEERTGERTIVWHRDRKLAYTAANAPLDAAKRGKILHLTPHDGDACVVMATAARSMGAVVSMDIDNVFDGIDRLLPLVDVCIGSGDLIERLFGTRDKREGLRKLAAKYGCAVAGLTLGESGSVIYANDQFIETPAYAVPGGCVDTTGAGDAFRTGFLYGILTGATVEKSAVLANATASLKCRGHGARSALPTLEELSAVL